MIERQILYRRRDAIARSKPWKSSESEAYVVFIFSEDAILAWFYQFQPMARQCFGKLELLVIVRTTEIAIGIFCGSHHYRPLRMKNYWALHTVVSRIYFCENDA